MSLIKKKNKDIRIIPLGGVGEIAKNMYIVEVDDEMFNVRCWTYVSRRRNARY
ncbi:hypothetical protein ACVXZZ_13865 [Staphylococcus aureus]